MRAFVSREKGSPSAQTFSDPKRHKVQGDASADEHQTQPHHGHVFAANAIQEHEQTGAGPQCTSEQASKEHEERDSILQSEQHERPRPHGGSSVTHDPAQQPGAFHDDDPFRAGAQRDGPVRPEQPTQQ